VPYIVRGPDIAPGVESDALIYLPAPFPTFCDLAGIPLPATLGPTDGKSFQSVLRGVAATVRSHQYGVYAGGSTPGIRAVTDGRWKLIEYDVGNHATHKTQLFDLKNNPFELLPEHGVPNLADHPAFAGIRQDLEEHLMRLRKELNDPHAFLGDRVLFPFEEGAPGQPATNAVLDFLPWRDNALARSGNSGPSPAYSSDVYAVTDSVAGRSNTLSLEFEQDHQHYLEVADSRELDFGVRPFTIGARVKLESLPTGDTPPQHPAPGHETGARSIRLNPGLHVPRHGGRLWRGGEFRQARPRGWRHDARLLPGHPRHQLASHQRGPGPRPPGRPSGISSARAWVRTRPRSSSRASPAGRTTTNSKRTRRRALSGDSGLT